MSRHDISSEPDATGTARVVLRPISSPLPLGLLALCTGSLLLSSVQLRWIPVTQSHLIALGVLAITVPLQALGSVLGFLGRDPASGTGMGLLGGTWAVTGLALVAGTPGQPQPGLGMALVTAAGALLVPTAAGALGKPLLALAIGGAAARFAITGGYELSGSAAWQHSSGIAGVVVAALAWYGALAFELEGAAGRPVLPVLRIGRGRRAASGRLTDQTSALGREAGVREQL